MAGSLKDVLTGEVAVGGGGDILRSLAIGSCVVVAVYSRQKKVGGLAHIMLPGNSPQNNQLELTRYAGDAIDDLLSQMAGSGIAVEGLEACLIGAGNVLKRADDVTASGNLDSVREILREKNMTIRAQSVGGLERRSARLDTATGELFFSVAGGPEALLWSWS